MSEGKIWVRLSGPAKLGGRWLKSGDELEVTADERDDLDALGLLAPLTAAASAERETRTFTGAEWEAAVQAEARKIAGAAFDGELDKIAAEAKEVVALVGKAEAERDDAIIRATAAETQRDQAFARVVEAGAQRDQALARIAELEAQIAASGKTETSPEGQAGEEAGAGADAADAGGAAPATQNNPPAPKAAKTAPKKGAAATTKG